MSSDVGAGEPTSGRSPAGVTLACRLGVVVLLSWAALRGVGEPLLAVADRGDFYRVGDPAGIVVPQPDLSHPRPVARYQLRSPSWDSPVTSGALVALAARAVPVPSAPPGTLDVRQIGLAYTVVLGAAVALALACGLPPALALLLTWASVGPARLALQNTLLTEPAALVGLSGLVALLAAPRAPTFPGAALRLRQGAWFAFVLLAALAGFARAAAALLPLTLVVSLALTPWGGALRQGGRRRWAVLALLVACLPLLHAVRGDVARFRDINVYHAVFRGVALLSSEPPSVLARLGIDARHVERVGSSYFDGPVPRDLSASLARVSRAEIAVELLREPSAMGRALERMTHSLGEEWTPGGGEVPRRDFEWWSVSSVHSLLFGPWAPLIWLAGLGAATWCLLRGSRVRPAALLLVLTVLSQLAITVLGDGLFAVGRHLVLARGALDLLCVLAVGDAVNRFLPRLVPAWRSAP